MNVTVRRELDISDLYDTLEIELPQLDPISDACLVEGDMSPGVLNRIFSALADEAARREEKEG